MNFEAGHTIMILILWQISLTFNRQVNSIEDAKHLLVKIRKFIDDNYAWAKRCNWLPLLRPVLQREEGWIAKGITFVLVILLLYSDRQE